MLHLVPDHAPIRFAGCFDDGPVNVDEQQAELPRVFSLEQNYPNPFSENGVIGNAATAIRFTLPSAGKVSLAIYDVSGRLIDTLESGNRAAGEHLIRWDGRDNRGERVASGVYFYRLTAGDFVATRKLVLLK